MNDEKLENQNAAAAANAEGKEQPDPVNESPEGAQAFAKASETAPAEDAMDKEKAMAKERELTLGEKRVRVDFNVAEGEKYDLINAIKTRSADLINMINELPNNGAESGRLKSLATTKFEEAAMWGVKAATS